MLPYGNERIKIQAKNEKKIGSLKATQEMFTELPLPRANGKRIEDDDDDDNDKEEEEEEEEEAGRVVPDAVASQVYLFVYNSFKGNIRETPERRG